MKPIRVFASLLCLVVLTLSLSSCRLFKSACDSALPALTQATILSGEALVAIDQVRGYAQSLPANDPIRGKLTEAVAKAETALRAANATLAASSSACSQPDLKVIFAGFVQAWDAIKPLIALFGTPVAGVSAQRVPDPAVYLSLKK
jgi:hypothetical protein